MYPYALHPSMSMFNPYLAGHPMALGLHPMAMSMHPMGMHPMGMHSIGTHPTAMGLNPMMFAGMNGPMLPGAGLNGAGLSLDHSRAAHVEAQGQSSGTGGFSAGDGAWALRFGVEGLEWYGRRVMRNYPHVAHAVRAEGALRAGTVLRGVGNGRPAAWAGRVLGSTWSGRVGGWWANAAANKMVGQAGLRTVNNPAARAAMSSLDDAVRAASAGAGQGTALAIRGSEIAARSTRTALARGAGTAVASAGAAGSRAAATTIGKGLGRLVPVMNVGIAALDGAQFVQDLNDPEAGVGRKIASGVTAGLSAVAATNVPVVSQVAGVAALGAALIRDLF